LLLSCSAAHAQSFTNIIDPLNPTFTQALGINDAGTVVGYGNATTFNGFTFAGGTSRVSTSLARMVEPR
jgi:hypothetical protein